MTAIQHPANPALVELVMAHDLRDSRMVHTDLDVSRCACRHVVYQRPQQTGNTCANCGGMAVQTGTCTTCTECGTSGGC